jgi:pimeloyl-ACP methyl ester carboxylesterase
MGGTSPRDASTPYHLNLIADTRALLEHTHPSGVDAIYLGGGSYGTAMAQMIYGAPYDLFPQGRAIKGVLLMAGFSPFKHHTGYAKCLSWPNYVAVGPPSTLPFRMFQRVFSSTVAPKLRTVEGSRVFLSQTLFDKMDPEERAVMDRWLASRGKTYDEFITSMSENNVRSVANTWDGFMEVSEVLHSDWGFDPRTLDKDHAKPVLVVSGAADDMGGATNQWIADNYANATFRTVPGGHIAGLFYMDELWDQLVALGDEHASKQTL